MQAITLFGSNSGNKFQLIEKAKTFLARQTGNIINCSSYYETEPWGFECQENFLNQVVIFETDLPAGDFLHRCLETEHSLGRQRLSGRPRYSSRPIDIDILFYDTVILDTPELTVPHPRIAERNFVLIPLAEILPDFIHPVCQKTITTLQKECPDKCQVSKITRSV